MKTCSSTKIFPANRTIYFSQLLKTTLLSETIILEYLFKLAAITLEQIAKTPFVVLVYLLLTSNILNVLLQCFFADFEHPNAL